MNRNLITILFSGFIVTASACAYQGEEDIFREVPGQLTVTFHPVDRLSQAEKDHAQLAFCFGGYSVLYDLAQRSRNQELAIKIDSILRMTFNKMEEIESDLAEAGELNGVWGAMMAVAFEVQLKDGVNYIRRNGPTNFVADMEKCQTILKAKV